MPETKLEPIAPVLKKSLKKQGYMLTKAAKTLSLSPDSLRGWIHRNSFPQEHLLRLAQLAGLPADLATLKGQYHFDLHTHTITGDAEAPSNIFGAFGYLDLRVEDILRSHPDRTRDLRLLFGGLRRGDIFVYCSLDEIPFEMGAMGTSAIGYQVASAVRQGACLLYLHPSKKIVDAAKLCGLQKIPSSDEFNAIFEKFRDNVRGMLKNMSREEIDYRIISFECDANPFMVPGHGYLLCQPTQSYPARALVSLPCGGKNKSVRFHVPLSEEFTNQFLGFILTVLSRGNRTDLISLFSTAS